jgi:hypothetical protein
MDPSSVLALAFLVMSFFWALFLVSDVRRRPNPPSVLRQLGLLCHNVSALFLLVTDLTACSVGDTALVWFVALMAFRYWRTLTNIWFWFQYQLAVTSSDLKITPGNALLLFPL